MAVPEKKSIQAYPLVTEHSKYMHICEERKVKASAEITDFISKQNKKYSHLLINFKETK